MSPLASPLKDVFQKIYSLLYVAKRSLCAYLPMILCYDVCYRRRRPVPVGYDNALFCHSMFLLYSASAAMPLLIVYPRPPADVRWRCLPRHQRGRFDSYAALQR